MTDTELSEAVAKKLGWGTCSGHEKAFNCGCHIHRIGGPFLFAASISAAWEVVGKILELSEGKLPNKFMLSFLNERGWDCTINGFHVIADSPARAICEAFLKLP